MEGGTPFIHSRHLGDDFYFYVYYYYFMGIRPLDSL